MKDVFIVAAKRTALGSFGGVFSSVSATDLGSSVLKGAIDSIGLDPRLIEELYFGSVVQANLGQAPATQVVLGAGLPSSVPATLINKVCASGMKAIMLGAGAIAAGAQEIVAAGGMENMSQIPYYLEKARYGYGYGNGTLIDGLAKDGLTDVYSQKAMGCFADATAVKYDISRSMQDDYAIRSYQLVALNTQNGFFQQEISPVEIKDKKGNVTVIAEDEEYKRVKFEKIPGLRPAFTPDGTVTAANASTINDGAAALLLASEEAVKAHNLTPLARIVSYADAAQDPEWFTTAPILAAEKALKMASLSISDMDFFEINEAFSAVPLAFGKHFDIVPDRLNARGGAVALGHPLGASGARIVVTLQNILSSTGARYGLAAICNGGGGASAMVLERV